MLRFLKAFALIEVLVAVVLFVAGSAPLPTMTAVQPEGIALVSQSFHIEPLSGHVWKDETFKPYLLNLTGYVPVFTEIELESALGHHIDDTYIDYHRSIERVIAEQKPVLDRKALEAPPEHRKEIIRLGDVYAEVWYD